MKASFFQAILIGVFGLSALVGLFVFATYTNSGGGKDSIGSVVIWGALPKDGMQETLITIAKTNADFKNVSYVQKDPDTLPSDLAAAIATGEAPDLVLSSHEYLHALKKFITPIPHKTLSRNVFTNAFIEGAEVFSTSDGYYGIPFLIDPLVLFWNRSILSNSGIAKPPATWESLTGLVPNVAILTPTRQITRSLVALGAYDNVHNARGILSLLFLQTGVPLSSYSANGVFGADLGMSASSGTPPGKAVLNFYTQFADPSKVSYSWNASLSDSRQTFLSGDLAFYFGYVSEANYLRSANSNLNFNVAYIPQPANATIKRAYGLIYAFMIPRGAKNPAGAYKIAVLFSNSDEQSAASSATGLAPVSLNTLAVAPADPISVIAYAEALYTKGWMSPVPADTDSVFSSMIEGVISGRSSLDTALSSAERTLGSLLQQ